MRITVPAFRRVMRGVRNTRPLSTCGAALLVLMACGDTKTNARAEPDARAATSVSGAWSDADEKSTWTATRDDANSWRIDETAHFGDDGRATRRFIFDSLGALRSVSDDKAQTAQSGNATPMKMHATLTLEFAGDSTTRRSKQVDGVDRATQPFEIDNAKRHAQQLWTLLRQTTRRD